MQAYQTDLFSNYSENQEVYHAHELQLVYKKSPVIQKYDFVSNSSKKAEELLRQIFDEHDLLIFESFYVLFLNTACKVVGFRKIGQGGNDFTPVDVKQICSTALLTNCNSVILAHNHPSGTLFPSQADKQLTKKIIEALNYFDIKVNDHIILTEEDYYSFRDNDAI